MQAGICKEESEKDAKEVKSQYEIRKRKHQPLHQIITFNALSAKCSFRNSTRLDVVQTIVLQSAALSYATESSRFSFSRLT